VHVVFGNLVFRFSKYKITKYSALCFNGVLSCCLSVVNISGEKTFLMVGFEDIILFWNIKNIKNM